MPGRRRGLVRHPLQRSRGLTSLRPAPRGETEITIGAAEPARADPGQLSVGDYSDGVLDASRYRFSGVVREAGGHLVFAVPAGSTGLTWFGAVRAHALIGIWTRK